MRVTRFVAGITIVGLCALLYAGRSDAPDMAPPSQVIEVSDMATLEKAVRENAAAGNPIRVEYNYNGRDLKPRNYDSWPASPELIAFLKRTFERSLKATVKNMHRKAQRSTDPTELEMIIAKSVRLKTMFEASLKVLDEEGACFVTNDIVLELTSNDDWHYFNYGLKDGKIAYIPLDLKRFPEVKAGREQYREIKKFIDTDQGFKWNNRPYDERRKLITKAKEMKKSWDELNARLSHLRNKESRTAEEQGEIQSLNTRMANLVVDFYIPRKYDPTSLEWLPQ